MWEDCLKEVKSCKLCKLYNVKRGGFHPMRTILAERPMDHVVMDFIGPLKASDRGFVFVLLLVDVHTRFVFLRPMVVKKAVEVAYELVNVFASFGVPKILQSDNDPSFVNEVIEEFLNVKGFEHCRIMKYFPCTNGVTEKFCGRNQVVVEEVGE